jgi:beta-glucosidase
MPQFEACVESGGLGMMCSFNSIRGVPACANHRSMVTWARGQWNFPGYIVSDQGAAYGIYSSHKYARNYSEGAAFAVKGGLDLEDTDSPADSIFALGLPGAVADGLLVEADIDQSVSRLIYVRMKTGEFDDPVEQPYRQIAFTQIRSAAHLALTKEVATKSFVLLANRKRTLPLKAENKYKIAVVGPFADCTVLPLP